MAILSLVGQSITGTPRPAHHDQSSNHKPQR
jgi:hypothetical protein